MFKKVFFMLLISCFSVVNAFASDALQPAGAGQRPPDEFMTRGNTSRGMVQYELTLGAGALQFMKDPVLKSFFKNPVLTYRLDFAAIFNHIAGVEGSLGFVYGKNNMWDSSHTASEQYDMLIFPARIDGVAQLRFYEDQPVYPYAGAGFAASGFDQVRSYDSQTVSGFKFGWNWIAGVHFLLDPLDESHVGILRTEYGIDHVFIDIRVGQDYINNFNVHASGFNLSDQYITGALGFEF